MDKDQLPRPEQGPSYASGIGSATHPLHGLAILMAMAGTATRFPSPSRPLSSTPTARWASMPTRCASGAACWSLGLSMPGPRPLAHHLLAAGLTRPDLATTTPSYVFQVCPRALSINSPAGESSTPLRSVPAGTPGTTASPRAGPPRDRGSALAALPCAPAPSRGTPPHVPGSR